MTLALILVVAAALALIFILSITVSRSLQVSNTSLAGRLQPLDLEAFRNLTDAAEDEYLRRRLRPADFRGVRRERLRAVAAYVQVAGRNATLLVRIGQSALTANDPQTADAAHARLAKFRLRGQAHRARLPAVERIRHAAGTPAESRSPGAHLRRFVTPDHTDALS
jgi:hypothetical protein